MTAPIIVWFRRDLRLADNPALAAAVEAGAPVVPLYIHDDVPASGRPAGGAGHWWLHHSLKALDASLGARGSRLVLRRGPADKVLPRLIGEIGASVVHLTRRYDAAGAAADGALAERLRRDGIACRRFGGGLLAEPEAVATKDGGPYKVFTPFYKALRAAPPPPPKPVPAHLPAPAAWPQTDDLDAWRLLPTSPDWAGGLRATWTPGEAAAAERLESFLDGPMADYAGRRDRPDRVGTSRLSPHLHFGEIGPRQVWHGAAVAAHRLGPGFETGCEAVQRQLAWRDFSHHLLHHWPDLAERPFRPAFAAFPWRDDPAGLRAWQRGRTGYPLVDAGMRELWATGWMHNRVRMVAASFLVKHLLIHWREGEAWFWDTLVDADPANNAASWQWVAGSGADAAPYFRIFNPVGQGRKFDPDGAYVRRWLPELAGLPDNRLHAPWTALPEELEMAGVVLGETYPAPIVDHALARRRALDAFATIRRR